MNLYQQSRKFISGGVNSPVRSFSSIDKNPIFVDHAKDVFIYTHNKRKLIDFCCSWGALILGHANKNIIKEINKTSLKGTSFGFNHINEIKLAKMLVKAIPSIDLVRFVNSGTESCMTAIRLARGYTKKNIIIKFEGCYHGHSDSMLVKAGSGLLTLGVPSSKGIPKNISKDTIVIKYNDFENTKKIISKYKNKIAGIIVEAIPGNMGVVKPKNNFLKNMRKITKENNILLILDEVITGFRFCFGGYQNIINVKPDLTCLGKIIGGGLPFAAIGGKKEIMEKLAPLGHVYQAGTLSGNPIAVSASLASLKELKKRNFYKNLNKKSNEFIVKLNNIIKNYKIPIKIQFYNSMFTIFCINNKQFSKMHAFFLKNGILLPPSQYESCFISSKHLDKHLNKFINIFEEFVKNEK